MNPIAFRWIVDAATKQTPLGELVPEGAREADPVLHIATRVHDVRRLPQSEADRDAKADVQKVEGFVLIWAQDPERVRSRLAEAAADATPVVTDGAHVYTAAEALAVLRGVYDDVSLVGTEFP